jgi:hypothetical protein
MHGYIQYLPIVFIIALGFMVYLLGRANKPSLKAVENLKEPELTARFRMGQYLEGLPEQKDPCPLVSCGVTEESFVIRKGTEGEEIGRIARTSVTNINISKQGDKICCLEINWDDICRAQQRAIFRFEDKKRAEAMTNEAVQALKKWQKDFEKQGAVFNS